jgi:hypothetical protein
MDMSVAVLDHQDALTGDVGNESIARSEAVVAADVEPRPVEDPFAFAIEHGVRRVLEAREGGGQSAR